MPALITPTTATSPRRRRPARAARRLGYTVGLLVNAAMLFAVSVRPGWEAVPFLTDDTRLVLGFVNASIVVGLVANAGYLVSDPPWLKALGDMAQNIVGVAAMVRMWQVFPFDFGERSFNWDLLARWLLAVGIAGSVIGALAGVVSLVRATRAPRVQPPRAGRGSGTFATLARGPRASMLEYEDEPVRWGMCRPAGGRRVRPRQLAGGDGNRGPEPPLGKCDHVHDGDLDSSGAQDRTTFDTTVFPGNAHPVADPAGRDSPTRSLPHDPGPHPPDATRADRPAPGPA